MKELFDNRADAADCRPVSRRAFLSLAGAACLAAGAFALAPGCAGASDREPAVTATSAGNDGAASSHADASAASDACAHVLVACFSATGNTVRVARVIADALGADTFAIEPAQPYSDADLDYNDSSSRTSLERADETLANSVELAQVTPEGWDGYDVVLLGSPIWWGEPSWVVRGFVTGNDFSGKTVFYFCTSASSSLGGYEEFTQLTGGTGNWREGMHFSSGVADNDVVAWLDGLKLA